MKQINATNSIGNVLSPLQQLFLIRSHLGHTPVIQFGRENLFRSSINADIILILVEFSNVRFSGNKQIPAFVHNAAGKFSLFFGGKSPETEDGNFILTFPS